MTVADLVRRSAERWGGKPAVVEPGREILTFAGLRRRMEDVAAGLRVLGVRSGDRVALLARNRLEWVEVFFAVAACGAVFVPLNPRLTDAEISVLLADAMPAVFITDDPARLDLDTGDARTSRVLIGEGGGGTPYRRLAAGGPRAAAPEDVRLSDPQAIVYTSGTTGGPKGVVLTHRNVATGNFLLQATEFRLDGGDVFLVSTPLCHRVGATRVVTAAGLGATCVVLPRFDVQAFAGAVDEHGVTVVGTVPTVVRLLGSALADRAFPSVTAVLMTGERVTAEAHAVAARLFPNARVYGFYASTEGGVVAVRDPGDAAAESCGRPVLFVEVRIDTDRPGGEGEILIRSDEAGSVTVAAGYWREGRVEPFPGGWFRTGDIGRFEADGTLTVLDRQKDVIITGGFNVYCPDVELALASHPEVVEAAAVGCPDPVWGEAVCAFFVPRPNGGLRPDDLQAFCRTRLPGYAVPRRVFVMDRLPRNALGKVLKTELRALAAQET